MRFFLVGYMYSGKTTIGKKLANCLGYKFVDTDSYFEIFYGYSVEHCILTEGEEIFRIKEKEILFNLLMLNDVVISTGGGTPCYFNQMELMKNEGIVVYLQSSLDLIMSRIVKAKKSRPLLQNLTLEQKREKVEQHLKIRLPIYEQAHLSVCSADVNIENLVQDLKKAASQVSFV